VSGDSPNTVHKKVAETMGVSTTLLCLLRGFLAAVIGSFVFAFELCALASYMMLLVEIAGPEVHKCVDAAWHRPLNA
jgi:hypothetical protein